jgi:hypothetical protein
MPLTESEVTKLGNVLLGKLMERSIRAKYIIAAKAGMDVSKVPGVQNNALVNPAIACAFGRLDLESKLRALPILANEIAATSAEERKDLTRLLHQHGYEYINGTFVPVGLIDEREARFMPPTAAEQISSAFSRLVDGDESGAITSACGAVDSVTTSLYEKHNLGNPGASFQTKVNTVLDRLNVIGKLEQELGQLNIQTTDAHRIAQEVHEATKHATEALQVIRRTMGDVHGNKPTYTRIVYDSIKWASAICGLFEGE